ncbi:zinc-dependent metalloprotease [Flagellimonas olearia]|nr:zinc-dependent metalloprotease [Allomuricauda olearia]
MTCQFLLSCIIGLVACPLWGQANFGIRGKLERERVILELQEHILDVPLLFVRHGDGQLQVKWSRQRGMVQLDISWVDSKAGVQIPMYHDSRIRSHILGRFPILGDKKALYTIDATDLFLNADISWGSMVPETIDPKRSYIDTIVHLDNELVIRTKRTTTYAGKGRTVAVDFSFYALPEPMMPRLFDHRMAYSYEDRYSPFRTEPKTEKGSIMRWRLEKKYPEKPIGEPVRPITLYLDPNIPEKWKPYVKAGILEWLPAFEQAGFKNAIVIREMPKDSMAIVGQSINRSMVRWKALEEVRGHKGGASTAYQITDFRSGEILKADINLGTDVNTLSDAYFIRCAPVDVRAQKYPFPDALVGSLIQAVAAHEMGHVIGINDAHFGEFAYPFEKIRDTDWLRAMGHTPSIMNYSRHHHIAQPEDGIPTDLLLQRVGPLDKFHIKWGYAPVSGTERPEDELPFLDAMILKYQTMPWFRFNYTLFEVMGPGSTDEVPDNDNPIQSTVLGLRNLERVMELIPQVNQGKRDHELMERLHSKTLDFWYAQMYRVVSMVGGYSVHNLSGKQEGTMYEPIPWEDQMKALEFLLENAFEVPEWLARPSFQAKTRYTTNIDYLLQHQLKLLEEILDPLRLQRLEYAEEAYFKSKALEIYFRVLQKSLFKELAEKEPIVGRRRQSIQKAYLSILTKGVQQEVDRDRVGLGFTLGQFSENSKVVMQVELGLLQRKMKRSLGRTKNLRSVGHLERCLFDMEKVWD